MDRGKQVKAVLARQGWSLRRVPSAGRIRFALGRAGTKRDLCDLSLAPLGDARRPLTPSVRLRARLLPGAALRNGERAGLEELRAALCAFLEPHGQAGPALGERHEGKGGRELLLRTTFACNQRCPFCFVPLTGRAATDSDISAELAALSRHRGPGAKLIISGGEPTVDPRLPVIISAAKLKGFRRFVLQTNAVRFAQGGLLERLLKLGVSDYMVSFHTHKPALYDRITGSRGQYAQAAAGLARLIRSRTSRVTVNVVVNKQNYRDLPGLIDFLGGLVQGRPKSRRVGVYFSMLNEAGHEKAPSWAVSLEAVRPYLGRAVEDCGRLGLSVERFGSESSFPVCVLHSPEAYAARRAFAQDRVRYAERFSGEAGAVGRAKRPSCRSCAYDARCQGVPAAYARMFGLKALGAVDA